MIDASTTLSNTHSAGQSNGQPNPLVTMNLNGTKLTLNNKGRWEMTSTDLDLATLEIERLLNEKDTICQSLAQALQQIDDLRQEVRDLNKVKTTTLEMLMLEREERISMENQVEGYKKELKESFRVIVELRKLIDE